MITSDERGVTTTGVFCMWVSGFHLSPILVFRGLRFNSSRKFEFLQEQTLLCLKMVGATEVFLKWLKHFVAFVRPTSNRKVLLNLN